MRYNLYTIIEGTRGTALGAQRPASQFLMFENWLAGRCAPSAVPLVDDVVKTSEMARQNGREPSYPRNRQGQVFVGVYGRCCGSIVAKKLASLGRSSTRFHLDKAAWVE